MGRFPRLKGTRLALVKKDKLITDVKSEEQVKLNVYETELIRTILRDIVIIAPVRYSSRTCQGGGRQNHDT